MLCVKEFSGTLVIENPAKLIIAFVAILVWRYRWEKLPLGMLMSIAFMARLV